MGVAGGAAARSSSGPHFGGPGEARSALPEVAYALRQSKDPRALPPLLHILTASQDDTAQCVAADALGELEDASVEPQLLDALAHCDDRCVKARVCRALGKVGTARSLPELRTLAADKRYQGAINVAGAAREAVEAIEQRHPK